MTVYVALLHSIILDAGRRVVMSDLRMLAENLGFRAPRTLVATGNIVFEAEATDRHAVEANLEAGFKRDFGKHVDIIVRASDEWHALAGGNPFATDSETAAANVIVRVMRHPLEPGVLPQLERYCTAGERLALVDGDLWIHFPGRPSLSKLASALTTKRLGPGTLRNWNTVRGLRAMIDG